MKLTFSKFAMAFAAASIAIAANAHAQSLNANSGDLILCFQDSNSADQGFGSNLECDLGQFSNFLPGGSYATGTSSLTQLAVADLASVYGNNWASLTSLSWSVVGALDAGEGGDGVPDYTLFGTDNSNGSSEVGRTNSTQSNTTGAVDQFVNDLNNLNYTANSTSDVVDPTSDSESYYKIGHPQQNPVYGFNDWSSTTFTTPVTENGNSSSASLYVITPSTTFHSGTNLGTFTLNSSGLSYTAAAVPEPSTWATIALGAVSLLAFRRRSARA